MSPLPEIFMILFCGMPSKANRCKMNESKFLIGLANLIDTNYYQSYISLDKKWFSLDHRKTQLSLVGTFKQNWTLYIPESQVNLRAKYILEDKSDLKTRNIWTYIPENTKRKVRSRIQDKKKIEIKLR